MGDVVAAALAAAESEATGPINVGTGIETDVLELAARLGELGGATTSSPSSPRPATARCSGSRSTRRAPPRELGWRAEMGLAEGLRVTLDSI